VWLLLPRVHYSPTRDPAGFKRYWSQELTARGPQEAFARVQKEFAHADPNEQHYAVHIMGELLFEERGLDGLRECTDVYGYGCYHGFFTAAIGALGEPVVNKLDGVCLSLGKGLRTESCQHGVGHGILEYLGPQRLTMALQWCAEKVADVFPALGCKSGVFMEYFNPQLDPGRAPIFNTDEPLNVCGDLPIEEERTCVYELSVLWRRAALPPAQVDGICTTLPTASVRESCYIGYGNFIAPEFDFSIEKAGALCDQMSPRGAALCRAGIYWSLSQEAQPERAPLSCEPLAADLRALCIEKGHFACTLDQSCA
jgi:hypothetical protein